MGSKRKQRSEDIARKYNATILAILFRQKLQDLKFEKLVQQGFIKEIKNGESESIHL